MRKGGQNWLAIYIYVSDLLPRVAVLFEPPLVLIRVCVMTIAIDSKRSLDVVLSTTTVTWNDAPMFGIESRSILKASPARYASSE